MVSAARLGGTPAGTDGSLSRLLETEALLAARLAAAEEESARIREAARDAARAADTGFERELAAALGALEQAHAERRAARLAAVEAEKVRRVESLRALSSAQLDRLAAELVERVLRQATGGTT